jgi:hypothetical protein
MVVDVTTETNVRSLPNLNNAADTLLLNNVRTVGELVFFQYFLFKYAKYWASKPTVTLILQK